MAFHIIVALVVIVTAIVVRRNYLRWQAWVTYGVVAITSLVIAGYSEFAFGMVIISSIVGLFSIELWQSAQAQARHSRTIVIVAIVGMVGYFIANP
ncbi:MAG: hypothetical protein COU81_01650 [Candidatus Portnoybacteria bacterium CG10_big_fil_rev_8_21_14_0_10_36_7]|uniref:Uncharacterized protein n=1 Tax=Candidatus Portnoybacteria bacterium CG10_big_fil_rev_8_21_14_0_10_36_7 TaxID=1974812 RepID=A0A2M8KEC7_9BACT|nr:MAG: hypothetical protein COU81_01650 [Candidatus Portnoybacteria bacterium CG10_big_fil_rev_8_21_14_0_10_36_7]